ncbi:MAG: hypothetical protein JWP87_3724 [Labilithrix sp.]|nr:hypothetical protein [Labilithrix sp.]
MIDLATLEACSDLTSEHAKLAASSSAEIRKLLKRVAEIAKPGEGCPKVLMAVAHLVGKEWVEGDLRIELSGDDTSTTLTIMCDYGVGIRERLLPNTRFAVPIDEFERALELAPRMVLPLRITDEPGKIVLTPLASPEALVKSVAPALDLDNTSLGDGERTTAPPPADELVVVDEAMPEDLDGLAAFGALITGESNEVKTAPPSAAAYDAEHAGRMESGPVPSGNERSSSEPSHDGRISNVHTRPTVRRMVAVDAAAIAAVKRRDPRREEE